jgi:hypothetical protein
LRPARIAGGRDDTPDFYGLVTAICVAPLNGAARPDAPAPRENPNRKETYMEPIQAFDDLYWMETPSTSSWLLTSDDGYILYDTQRVYDAEDVLVAGIKKLGIDPAKVKYVIIPTGTLARLAVPFCSSRAMVRVARLRQDSDQSSRSRAG